MKDSCCISAISIVTSLGENVADLISCLGLGGAHGLSSWSWSPERKTCWIGRVSGRLSPSDEEDEDLPSTLRSIPEFDSRNARITERAIRSISPRVEELKRRYGSDRIGVVIGTSTSGIEEGEALVHAVEQTGCRTPRYRYAQQETGTAATATARLCGVEGPAYAVSTACSSSAKVIRSARALLRMGICDAVITGGCDSLCGLTIEGFGSLGLLSPDPCIPFSRNRSGIAIGEGAALMILERKAGGVQVAGIGESSDAYHMAAPDPEGKGAARAMLSALADAGITSGDISYVNLHGTGTLHNDAMEARATTKVFSSGVACSSTKGYTGHLLGASGAIEAAIIAALLMDSQTSSLPVHRWDGEADPELPLLDLVTAPRTISHSEPLFYMSNSFGFGGSNCSIILGRGI